MTTTQTEANVPAVKAKGEKSSGEVTYIPFGESTEITLKRSHVEQFIQVKTKSGKSASKSDIVVSVVAS